MTKKYEVENLLRPPFELISAATFTLSAIYCALAPHTMMMPSIVGYVFAVGFALFAIFRWLQASEILRYQKHLKRLPRFSMSSKTLPVSQNGLFLGKGFLWKTRHTERLAATLDSKNEKYISRSKAYQWARRMTYTLEHTPFEWFSKLLNKDIAVNPFRPDPEIGGRPTIHGVGMDEEHEQYLPQGAREGTTIVVGQPGVGKSRNAEMFITQDIHRKNNIVIVIDPKGDAELFKRVYSETKKAGRLDQFRMLHLAFPENSCKWNAIGSFSRVTEIPSRMTGNLPEDGNAKSFKDFAWQFSKFISIAEVNLGTKPTYKSIKRHLRNIDGLFIAYAKHTMKGLKYPYEAELNDKLNALKNGSAKTLKGRNPEAVAIAQIIKEQEIYDPILADLLYMFELDREYYHRITIQIAPFLEKVTSGRIGEILSPSYNDPNDPRMTLDFLEVFRQGGVVYIGLDALTDPEVAAAVGEAAFSELTSLAGYLYNFGVDPSNPFEEIPYRPVCIHGDEFSDLIGPKFATLINKSRGVGYQLTLYTQTLSDILVKVVTEAKAGQVLGNIGTLFMMRPQETKTAQILTDKLPEVKVRDRISESGAADQANSIRFISSNRDRTTEIRVPLLSPAEVMALPKGQAFVLQNGNTLLKVRSPLLKEVDEEVPGHIKEIIDGMAANYSSNIDWAGVTNDWSYGYQAAA